jgi:acyl-CoA synthetase (AMP-forming)/AMP-acid ligase II
MVGTDRPRIFRCHRRTAEPRSSDGSMSTVGDVGYADNDGYLYLTDRATFMIISGDVNIYPEECENLLVTHRKVADAAVFGVPNEDLGRGGEGGDLAHARRLAGTGHRGRADRILRATTNSARRSGRRSSARTALRE